MFQVIHYDNFYLSFSNIFFFTEVVLPEETGVNLVAAYTSSCEKNETEPVEHILEQLKVIS